MHGNVYLAPTRVLVIGQPLLREIVRGTVADDPRVEIAAELDAASDLGDVVRRTAADVVVADLDGDPPATGMQLMRELRVRVISVGRDGRESFLSIPLGEVSPRRLLEVIAAASGPPFAESGS